MDTQGIIEWGGLLIIALLIFSETGFLLGLAIPGGETLVFTAGILQSTGTLSVSITMLVIVLIGTAILGDISGYFIGRKFEDRLNNKKDTWYFKHKYIDIARDYLHRHPNMALVAGKFLPVIRPFSPVVSGITAMHFSRFITFTTIASTLYISTFALAGYFLGRRFPIIKDYIGYILPISIAVAILIIYIQARKHKNNNQNS